MAVFCRKVGAKRIETVERHAAEKPTEEPLFGFPIGIKVELHQYENGTEQDESRTYSEAAAGKTAEGQQRVTGRERAVEVAQDDLSHVREGRLVGREDGEESGMGRII